MVAVWPATVPLFALQGGYGEEPERNVISHQPDVGPPVERPRSTIASDMLAFTTTMTFDQFDDLIEFYRFDLKQGTQVFYRPHPRNTTGVALKFKFTEVPKLSAAGPDFGQVTIQLRKMP